MQRSQKTKVRMENMQRCQEDLKNSLEEKINSVADRIAGKNERRDCIEEFEKKLLACGNEDNERNFVPAPPVPMLASPVSVKLSTYDGKINWEVYKT
ncbi:hypothetical protein TNCV_1918591 [Trichonephila clavipes]|nr:hypothetical protein TNCV_1918591 [Trichonephila clavipes]